MRHRLVLVLGIALASSLASARPSADPKIVALVNDQVIRPLAAKEQHQSKFSRAAPAPAERRVRLLDNKLQRDSAGDAFLAFAIDARFGWDESSDEARWNKATITGCVYPERGAAFIKRGNAFHPAAAAAGKRTTAAPDHTCRAIKQADDQPVASISAAH